MTSGPTTSVAANGEHDGYLDVVSTPANFGSDLRRGDGRLDRIGEGALEVRADGSPGTPAAPGWHGEPHRVPPLPPTGRFLGTLS